MTNRLKIFLREITANYFQRGVVEIFSESFKKSPVLQPVSDKVMAVAMQLRAFVEGFSGVFKQNQCLLSEAELAFSCFLGIGRSQLG